MPKKNPNRRCFATSNAFAELANMPPLRHDTRTNPDEPFDCWNSEVFQWIIRNPIWQEYIFNKARHSRNVIFDPETRLYFGNESQKLPENRKKIASIRLKIKLKKNGELKISAFQ